MRERGFTKSPNTARKSGDAGQRILNVWDWREALRDMEGKQRERSEDQLSQGRGRR